MLLPQPRGELGDSGRRMPTDAPQDIHGSMEMDLVAHCREVNRSSYVKGWY